MDIPSLPVLWSGASLDNALAVAFTGDTHYVLEYLPAPTLALWKVAGDEQIVVATGTDLLPDDIEPAVVRLFFVDGQLELLCAAGQDQLCHAVFDGARFVRKAAPGVPFLDGDDPGARSASGIAFDPIRQVIVLVSPTTGEIFERRATGWTRVAELGLSAATQWENQVAAAWDGARNAVVVLHNTEQDLSTFTVAREWNGKALGVLPSAAIDVPNGATRGATHPKTQRALFFVGKEVVELGEADFEPLSAAPYFTAIGDVCAGRDGVLECWGARVARRSGNHRLAFDGDAWSDVGPELAGWRDQLDTTGRLSYESGTLYRENAPGDFPDTLAEGGPERAAFAANADQRRAVVIGGVDRKGKPLHAAHDWTEGRSSFAQLAGKGAPSMRLDGLATWFGDRLLVTGGTVPSDDDESAEPCRVTDIFEDGVWRTFADRYDLEPPHSLRLAAATPSGEVFAVEARGDEVRVHAWCGDGAWECRERFRLANEGSAEELSWEWNAETATLLARGTPLDRIGSAGWYAASLAPRKR